tara:strand:+ start:76 stop:1152 length:1077 start_codon:yes stop_codon:yes gene_type:complete
MNFQYFLIRGDYLNFNKYIINKILDKNCKIICFEDKVTYLLSDNLIKSFQSNDIKNFILNYCYKNNIKINKNKLLVSYKRVNKVISKNNLYKLFSKFIRLIFVRSYVKINRTYFDLLNKFIFPFLFTGKFFFQNQLEKITQLSSGDIDLLLFTDELEVEAHKLLFKNKKVKVAIVENLISNKCRCSTNKSKKEILLSPLSGFVGSDSISNKYLELFVKSFRISLTESGTKKVHLRPHPRENGKWHFQLSEYLNKNGIPSEVVDPDKPISEIICDYAGVVGFASGMLRDARYACDYIFIVGFEELSKTRYENPKLVFGRGAGINWIGEDNLYKKSFFKRKLFKNDTNTTIVEQIKLLEE